METLDNSAVHIPSRLLGVSAEQFQYDSDSEGSDKIYFYRTTLGLDAVPEEEGALEAVVSSEPLPEPQVSVDADAVAMDVVSPDPELPPAVAAE